MSRRSTGPSRLVVDVVIHRDRAQCAYCGERPWGERGEGWSIQHRRPRQMGGDRSEECASPANYVILCGSGTTLCHGWAESHRSAAYNLGLLVPRPKIPSQVSIQHAVHGLCWLTDDGDWVQERPVMSA